MEENLEYGSRKFKCPHCNVIAQQNWFQSGMLLSRIEKIYAHLYLDYRGHIHDYEQEAIRNFLNHVEGKLPQNINSYLPKEISIAICEACEYFSIWVNKKIVCPKKISIDLPNEDLNDDIKSLYLEASNIFPDSPKGSTALLRLALQKLLMQIGKKGKNLNNDIKELVEEGLSDKIQKALDLVRVIGNNAVHPGTIDLDDNSDVALKLFKILNIIANEMITKPKEISELYNDLIPDETKEHINQRDKKET